MYAMVNPSRYTSDVGRSGSETPAATLMAVAVSGLLRRSAVLPSGLGPCTMWNIAHNNSRPRARIARPYIQLCVVFDLFLAGFFVILFTV